MKKLITIILVLALFLPAAAGADYDSLGQVQKMIMRYTDLIGSPAVHLTGTVSEIWQESDDLYHLKVVSDDKKAATSTIKGKESYFICILWVGYGLDHVPCAVGDVVTIDGTVNSFYSSVAIPWIYVKTINGLDTF